jgi:ATP-dependent DNA helicase RecG
MYLKQDIQWLQSFKEHHLTDEEARTLIVIREKGSISNAEYRTINGVDTLTASTHLRRLRDLELLEQKGRGNATFYVPSEKLFISARTPHINSLSEGLTPHISSLSEELPALSADLREMIQQMGKRTPPDLIKQAIKQLCASRPFKPSEIALLLKRNHRYVRDYYLTPLVEFGELELEFPDNPAHPQQAYKAKTP